MKHSLLLLLRGPMQSWGGSSRFRTRSTEPTPTKSGVIGLIAAALGRPRSASVEDLAALEFGVRIDQPGSVMFDYQTSEHWQESGKTNLVSRYYLSDAVFVAAVCSEDIEFLRTLESALRSPRFPLFLGRRSCPVSADLVLGIVEGDAEQALRAEPWHARPHHRKRMPKSVPIPIFRDARPGESGPSAHDVPVSFAQEHRRYEWRVIYEVPQPVVMENEQGTAPADPFWEAVTS